MNANPTPTCPVSVTHMGGLGPSHHDTWPGDVAWLPPDVALPTVVHAPFALLAVAVLVTLFVQELTRFQSQQAFFQLTGPLLFCCLLPLFLQAAAVFHPCSVAMGSVFQDAEREKRNCDVHSKYRPIFLFNNNNYYLFYIDPQQQLYEILALYIATNVIKYTSICYLA